MGGDMTPAKWEKEYAGGTPHWAKDMEPSQFAQDFATELQERKARTVLEIGAGNGRDSIFFAKKGFLVSAVDISPSAVELAKGNIESAGVDVNIQEGNAESLQFTNGGFDGVFSLSVLHSSNLYNSVPEVYRVLRHGGIVLVHIYSDTQYRDGRVNETIDLDHYIKLLKTSGFSIEDLYTEDEEKFDSFGEKHHIIVVKLRKG